MKNIEENELPVFKLTSPHFFFLDVFSLVYFLFTKAAALLIVLTKRIKGIIFSFTKKKGVLSLQPLKTTAIP